MADEGDVPGRFDYYVLALSWSANWCEIEGDRKNSEQCLPEHDYGWILHGLWPQYEEGYPKNCVSERREPTKLELVQMSDLMASPHLARHQWVKHGTCTNLMGIQYFTLAREAWHRVNRPELLRKLTTPVKLPASVIEDAFLEVNPQLKPENITVTCRDGMIQEARICMTRGLEPRPCGKDVSRDCSLQDALFMPIR
jgi:ribonuclease T2